MHLAEFPVKLCIFLHFPQRHFCRYVRVLSNAQNSSISTPQVALPRASSRPVLFSRHLSRPNELLFGMFHNHTHGSRASGAHPAPRTTSLAPRSGAFWRREPRLVEPLSHCSRQARQVRASPRTLLEKTRATSHSLHPATARACDVRGMVIAWEEKGYALQHPMMSVCSFYQITPSQGLFDLRHYAGPSPVHGAASSGVRPALHFCVAFSSHCKRRTSSSPASDSPTAPSSPPAPPALLLDDAPPISARSNSPAPAIERASPTSAAHLASDCLRPHLRGHIPQARGASAAAVLRSPSRRKRGARRTRACVCAAIYGRAFPPRIPRRMRGLPYSAALGLILLRAHLLRRALASRPALEEGASRFRTFRCTARAGRDQDQDQTLRDGAANLRPCARPQWLSSLRIGFRAVARPRKGASRYRGDGDGGVGSPALGPWGRTSGGQRRGGHFALRECLGPPSPGRRRDPRDDTRGLRQAGRAPKGGRRAASARTGARRYHTLTGRAGCRATARWRSRAQAEVAARRGAFPPALASSGAPLHAHPRRR